MLILVPIAGGALIFAIIAWISERTHLRPVQPQRARHMR